MKTKLFYIFLLLVIVPQLSLSQNLEELHHKITTIINSKNALVGVAISGENPKDTLIINNDKRFPLQSVFKFHIALAVLDQIEQKKLSLHHPITVFKEELLPNFWSPLKDEFPNGGTFPISKLINYAVAKSDNVACDVLLKWIGGPQKVDSYLKSKGIANFAITYNEEVMQSEWDFQFKNWTTPLSATQTLLLFYKNRPQLLTKPHHLFLWNTMKGTQTGKNRLKGLLPTKVEVAHKTGTSGTNKNGLTAAVNDIGIVFLPNGKYFAISVFVSQSTENETTNEKIIAEIAKASWDFFSKSTTR